MDENAILGFLVELAQSLLIDVRTCPHTAWEYTVSDHPGGALVRLKGKEILFLDSSATLADRTEAVVSALRGRDELEGIYLPPEIRALFERP
jgi:hypothetical protein